MAPEVDPQHLLGAARAAVQRREYDVAYRTLCAAREVHPLQLDDLSMLADAAWWLGRISECLSITEDLHHRYLDDGLVERAALQALDLGAMWFLRGELVLGSGWLSRARRLIEGQPSGRAEGTICYFDALAALEELRLDEAEAGARDLQRLGAELGDDTLTSLGLLTQGLTEIHRGRLREGFAILDEAMIPVIADTVSPEWAGNIYCTILSTCSELMDLPRAREWTSATERWVTGFSDAVMFLGVCRAYRMQLLAAEGAWARAEEEAAQVERDLAELNIGAVAEAAYQLGETYRMRGMHEQAAACYQRAEECGRDPQPGAALLRLAMGAVEEAWSTVTAAVADAAPHPFRSTALLRGQVEIGLAGGRVEGAAVAAAALEDVRDKFRTPGFIAWADEARGAVLLAQGEAATALPVLTRAAGELKRLGAPYDAAKLHMLLARAYHDVGDLDASTAHQQAAAAAFDQLGVRQAAEPDLRPRPRPGGLTSREAEVLASVATGRTNREAAKALFITEATVRRHLANIYLKLGVGSRTAATAWAYDHGVVEHRTG